MSRPQYILLPVSPFFIAITLVIAFLLNIQAWGRIVGVPDFVALALVFWGIHQPRRAGIGVAFFVGLMMDVNDATLFGENALAYTLLSYFAITIHRRVLWFSMSKQSVHVLLLLLMAQAVQFLVQYIVNGRTPSWTFFLESFVAAALWPAVTWLLQAPQRRVVNRDVNRPI
jgi:rod shape-determining protein MreD